MEISIPIQEPMQDLNEKENKSVNPGSVDIKPKTPKQSTPKKKKSWFKRGKLDFNQKPLDLEKEPFTINLLASFYQNKLESLDLLLVLLSHESSETVDQLSKRLQKQFRIQDVKEKLESLGSVVNYGNDQFPLNKWEASDSLLERLPLDLKDQLFDRRYERQDLQKEFVAYYENIPQEEMESLTRKRKESLGSNKRIKLDDEQEKELKEKTRQEKEAEKELKIQQKLEKEQQRLEKEALKEQQRLEKEALKEQQRLEKEALKQEKLAKKVKVDKSQTNILGFFKPVAKPVEQTNTIRAPVNRFKSEIKEYEFSEIDIEQAKREFNESFKNIKLIKDYHYKLLKFHTDLRPAYFGTWSKKSKSVNGKKPFGKDEALDYEVDSELEWEEEEEGEELVSENEEEPEEEDEMEDDWIVPNGYLSEDEGMGEEDDQKMKIDKSKLKERLKEKNVIRKLVELVPVVEGLYQMGPNMLGLKFELLDIVESKPAVTPRKQVFPQELEDELIKLVVDKEIKLSNLVEHVQENINTKLTKSCIEVKIKELFKKKGGKWTRKIEGELDTPFKIGDTLSKDSTRETPVKNTSNTDSKIGDTPMTDYNSPSKKSTPTKTELVQRAKLDGKFKSLEFFNKPEFVVLENLDLPAVYDNCTNPDPQISSRCFRILGNYVQKHKEIQLNDQVVASIKIQFETKNNLVLKNMLRFLLFLCQNGTCLGGLKELIMEHSVDYDELANGYYDQLKEFLK
ncbi:hypothetical protein HK103_004446 [Boothiomyces macroporosus]|uniref:Chromatin assembly factor 1 subunit A dimerization domain-containing protein n=1 Tax=Boothiomyces macroporosus TaxID=261099 RepID=A0AAD5UGI0_9FUNG|nr:hypothetical protein HK103_004446 [Boothiomyces macroporosus]